MDRQRRKRLATVCLIKFADVLDPIDRIDFGNWHATNHDLRRDARTCTIARCIRCDHVMIVDDYTVEAFYQIYHTPLRTRSSGARP